MVLTKFNQTFNVSLFALGKHSICDFSVTINHIQNRPSADCRGAGGHEPRLTTFPPLIIHRALGSFLMLSFNFSTSLVQSFCSLGVLYGAKYIVLWPIFLSFHTFPCVLELKQSYDFSETLLECS